MTGGGETAEPAGEDPRGDVQSLASALVLDRPIVLVGLMGAGKTTVGRRLAALLKLPFVDADEEIERAAGLTIPEIFDLRGEAEFRSGERRVIARLLQGPPQVLATGGGAFMNDETRALVRAHAISVWLRADLDVLMRRVEKRDSRPLLRGVDPRATMERLMAERYPVYAQADLTIDSNNGPHASAVSLVIRALAQRQRAHRTANEH
ncbi:MAG: shikimate kinase [Alphaproteobacteria bacterium]|nr:MAG: shikimate kinase [Caulobacteraceae bacterium]TPW03911.1 MAG: shikimate kinase [Alphaproteobacteria bacterium]